VTIGMELVIEPKLVVMDEPTSGLDSFTAANLLATCKQVRW
jgi:ABC-type multidrug transport system ATPase subunit